MRYLIVLLLCVAGNAVSNEYIHGTVNLKSGESHTGILRWDDDEETFWSDHFNGEKNAIPQFSSLSSGLKSQIEDAQMGPKLNLLSFKITLSSIFADDIEKPDFVVPFGALAKLTASSNDEGSAGLHVELLNGDVFESYEGSNDLDAEVFVKNISGETNQFKMRQIESIEFSRSFDEFAGFNKGIYAVIDSDMGTYKGRVFWDRDERFLNETIEGTEASKLDSEELSIPLSDIKSIEKKQNSALITKHDGTQLTLVGTNDVNDENRGLYIDTPDKGRMVLPWQHFNKMTIQDEAQHDWQAYHQALLKKGKLSAQVTQKDKSQITATNLVFNMAQTSSSEMVRCTVKGMDFYMPLFLIKSIEPKSAQHALVTLINGEQLNMSDTASFTEENLGLLYSDNGQSRYISWVDVEKIEFNH